MLYFSPTRVVTILLTCFLVCLFAVPNFLPGTIVDRLPKRAHRQVVLGLDLRGGSHLLLEVDSSAVEKEMTETLRGDVIRVLRDAHIGYSNLTVEGHAVQAHIRDALALDHARKSLMELSRPLGVPLGSQGRRTADIQEFGDGSFRLTVTAAAITERVHQAVQQSVQIIERRINELGTVEPIVESEGTDRIIVEVPGLQDPMRLKALLGKTAKLTFQLVDLSMTPEQALQGLMPSDSEVLYDTKHNPPTPFLVYKAVAVSGAALVDAQPGFDRSTGEPIVSFRFNAEGARRFADVTRDNVAGHLPSCSITRSFRRL